jgi:putative ABC transport system substrate-binding protein
MESAESLFGDVLKPFSTASTQLRHGRGLKCCAAVFLPYRIVLSFLSKAREGIRQVKRREFITLLGGAAAAWPTVPRAQPIDQVRTIAVLIPGSEHDPEWRDQVSAFVQALQKHGWIDGANLRIDYRWASDDPERIRTHVKDIISMKPDAILASTALTLLPLQQATRTIPIVFTRIYDPASSGFVASLARPEANITGFTLGEFSLGGKMLELLKEVAPKVDHVAVMLNPDQPPHVAMWRAIENLAQSLVVRTAAISVREGADIGSAFDTIAREPNGGLVVLSSPITAAQREQITSLAAAHRLPAVYSFRFYVTAGGLLSYGIDPIIGFQRAASYVDRILKGATPTELPVQQPTRFELAVNLNAAKALGLTIPEAFLLRADEVIE